MKTIAILFICYFFCPLYSADTSKSADLAELLIKVKKQTKNNWEVNGYLDTLDMTHKKTFSGIAIFKSMSGKEDFKSQNYSFSFAIVKKISPKKFKEHKMATFKNMTTLKKRALNEMPNELGKGHYFFYPKTKKQWTLYFQLLEAQRTYYNLPEYHYKGLGIKIINSPNFNTEKPSDKKILEEARNQEEKIKKLLTKY